MRKHLLILSVLFALLAPAMTQAAPDSCGCKKPKRVIVKVNRDSVHKVVKYDTVHVPYFKQDTVSLNGNLFSQLLAAVKQEVSLQINLPSATASGTLKREAEDEKTETAIAPYIAIGVRAQPHEPASWMAGIGVDLSRGPVSVDCSAMLERGVVTSYDSNDERPEIHTVLYGTLRYSF